MHDDYCVRDVEVRNLKRSIMSDGTQAMAQ